MDEIKDVRRRVAGAWQHGLHWKKHLTAAGTGLFHLRKHLNKTLLKVFGMVIRVMSSLLNAMQGISIKTDSFTLVLLVKSLTLVTPEATQNLRTKMPISCWGASE